MKITNFSIDYDVVKSWNHISCFPLWVGMALISTAGRGKCISSRKYKVSKHKSLEYRHFKK